MTNEETKKAADNLVESYWTDVEEIVNNECIKMTFNMAVHCAIQSVNHTIEVLDELKMSMDGNNYALDDVEILLDEQLELKKILEGRL